MDSEQLVRMLEFILEQSYQFDGVHDFLVVRNGYVVLEVCSPPSQRDTKREIICATRSLTSALLGNRY